MAACSCVRVLDKVPSVATGLVKNAIRCVGEDKLLNCLKIEMKQFEQEILLAGDMEPTVFEEFCTKLTDLLKCVISTDKIKLESTRKTKCWTFFHAAQKDSIPQLWKNVYLTLRLNRGGKNYLFTQSITRKLFEQLMIAHFSDESAEEPQEREEIKLTSDELKIVRYASGFVPYKLLRKYETKLGEKFDHFKVCLQGMAVNSDENHDFLEYTKSWIDKVNRGGLFSVNNETFNLFIAVETSVRQLLPNRLSSSKSDTSLQVLAEKVIEEIDVQFYWYLITQDLSVTEEVELLQELIQLWITIRGFSFASSWLELYKEATKSNV